jgi:phenylacetate-CoA ligase
VDLELLYQKTPIWMQNSIVSLLGWRLDHKRYGERFHRVLREYEKRTAWTADDLRLFRDERIRSFVMHCEKNVPYYRKLFRDLRISAVDIRGLADLKELPVLDKNTVQERHGEFLAENVRASGRLITHTSGTTGSGLQFATTPQALAEQWAVWWRYRRWHGIQRDTWCGYFGGRSVVPLSQKNPPFWRFNRPGKQIMFSAYHMTPGNIDEYLEELRKRRPPWIHGYPSLIALLASRVLDAGVDLNYRPRWITIGAESLLPQQAELIEQAFGVRPLQHYGLAEAVANISEWPDGELRVDEDFAAVEFLPNPNGDGHRIIGSNLSNPATPLLRYDTSDLADLGPAQDGLSSCGRIVRRIDGRKEDFILLRNGARLGRMDHIFKDMTAVREAQLYQREPGVIIVRIVKREGYKEKDEEKLLLEFRKRVGADTDIRFEYHETLTRTRSGKLRFVFSELSECKHGATQR